MPHARVRSIDTSAALAMPGVKAILTADDLPGARRHVTDLGADHHGQPEGENGAHQRAALRRRADSGGRGGRRAHRGRSDREDPDRVRAAAVRRRSAGQPAARRSERARRRQRSGAGRPPQRRHSRPAPVEVQELKWTEADFAEYDEGKLPMGKPHRRVVVRRCRGRLQERRARPRRDLRRRRTPAISRSSRARRWPTGRTASCTCTAGTQSTVQTVAVDRALGAASTPKDVVLISEYTGGGFGSKATGTIIVDDPGAAVEEGQCAGDDAHHARGRALHRRRAARRCTAASRSASTRTAGSRARPVRRRRQRPVRAAGRCRPAAAHRLAALSAAGDAVARRRGAHQHAAARARSAQPGGMQGITVMEPMLAKAARKLGIDQVAIRRSTRRRARRSSARPTRAASAPTSPARSSRKRSTRASSCSTGTSGRRAAASAIGTEGARRRRGVSTFVAGSIGFDGLFVIKPDGRMYDPVRHRQPRHRVGHRRATASPPRCSACRGRKCEVVWGNTSKNLPWTCVVGRQPDDARDDARGARGGHRRDQEAAGDRRQDARRQPGAVSRSPTSASRAAAAA